VYFVRKNENKISKGDDRHSPRSSVQHCAPPVILLDRRIAFLTNPFQSLKQELLFVVVRPQKRCCPTGRRTRLSGNTAFSCLLPCVPHLQLPISPCSYPRPDSDCTAIERKMSTEQLSHDNASALGLSPDKVLPLLQSCLQVETPDRLLLPPSTEVKVSDFPPIVPRKRLNLCQLKLSTTGFSSSQKVVLPGISVPASPDLPDMSPVSGALDRSALERDSRTGFCLPGRPVPRSLFRGPTVRRNSMNFRPLRDELWSIECLDDCFAVSPHQTPITGYNSSAPVSVLKRILASDRFEWPNASTGDIENDDVGSSNVKFVSVSTKRSSDEDDDEGVEERTDDYNDGSGNIPVLLGSDDVKHGEVLRSSPARGRRIRMKLSKNSALRNLPHFSCLEQIMADASKC
jgi:hypothetical protein